VWLVRSRRQADKRADLAAIGEASPGELTAVGLGTDLGNTAQGHQGKRDVCGTILTLLDPLIPLALQIQELTMDKAVASDFDLQTAPQAFGQRRAVPDPDRVERLRRCLAFSIAPVSARTLRAGIVTCQAFWLIPAPNASLHFVQPNSEETKSTDPIAVKSFRDAVCDIPLSPFFDLSGEGYSGVLFHSI
jgi:hypothetical protein